MAKPFNMDELAVRIRIVLRRVKPAAPRDVTATTHFFGWVLDTTIRLTSPSGKVLQLSAAEFALLNVFLADRGRPLKREDLLKRMAQMHDDSTAQSLDTLISRLRRKLNYAEPEAPDLIETVYGTGYAFRVK